MMKGLVKEEKPYPWLKEDIPTSFTQKDIDNFIESLINAD